jgi:hypothetical protein
MGWTTGMIALTNALVMLVLREVIDCTAGIRNTFRSWRTSSFDSGRFIADPAW